VLAGLSLPPDDMKRMYNDSVRLEVSSEEFRYWSRQARGAAVALERGERNLQKIEAAERQSANLP
jgi:hypothetical protein